MVKDILKGTCDPSHAWNSVGGIGTDVSPHTVADQVEVIRIEAEIGLKMKDFTVTKS